MNLQVVPFVPYHVYKVGTGTRLNMGESITVSNEWYLKFQVTRSEFLSYHTLQVLQSPLVHTVDVLLLISRFLPTRDGNSVKTYFVDVSRTEWPIRLPCLGPYWYLYLLRKESNTTPSLPWLWRHDDDNSGTEHVHGSNQLLVNKYPKLYYYFEVFDLLLTISNHSSIIRKLCKVFLYWLMCKKGLTYKNLV